LRKRLIVRRPCSGHENAQYFTPNPELVDQ